MTPELLEKCVITQAEGILSTTIDDEVVLMNLKSGIYSSFNSVASHIWNELKDGNGFFSILESILENFKVDREIACKELIEFLDEVYEKQFIEIQT